MILIWKRIFNTMFMSKRVFTRINQMNLLAAGKCILGTKLQKLKTITTVHTQM